MNKENKSRENKSIYLFIIEEEYKRNKAKRNSDEGFFKKTEPPTLITNHPAVIQELENMHPNYKVIQDPTASNT